MGVRPTLYKQSKAEGLPVPPESIKNRYAFDYLTGEMISIMTELRWSWQARAVLWGCASK